MASRFHRDAIKPVTDLRGKVREVFDQWPSLVETCLARITALVDGDLGVAAETQESLAVEREIMVGPHRFAMGTSDGWGFKSLYARGFDGGVLYKDAADGTRTYTVAKRSDLVAIPVGPASKEGTLLYMLARTEPGWGGSSSIGGSPRFEGGKSSSMVPGQVWDAVLEAFGPTHERFLAARRQG